MSDPLNPPPLTGFDALARHNATVLRCSAVLFAALGMHEAASYHGQLAIEAERRQWDLREWVRDTGDQT